MLLNPCFAALATPVTPYDKEKSLWIEQFSSVCLKGSHMLTCLTCFSHDLERPRAGKASARGRSRSTGPGSTSPHPGTVRLRRDDGEKAHCARGGKEKQPTFPFLLPVLFSSQAGTPPHPYCSQGSTKWVEKWASPKTQRVCPSECAQDHFAVRWCFPCGRAFTAAVLLCSAEPRSFSVL